jgi:two-component system, NtrC family, sensor histidine kinase HydH
MRMKSSFKMLLSGFSPWIIIGSAAVLLPVIALMTMETINRQKQQSIHLMIEKGAALIRSFEAGTRMGLRGGHGSGFRLQRLLVETAAQPDIAYLLVAGIDGTIIAHSQVDQVGGRYAAALNLEAVYAEQSLAWRRTTSPTGDPVFEVYGKFAPLARRPNRPMHGPMMDMRGGHPGPIDVSPMVIFVGFRTDELDAAHAAVVRHSVVMAAVLLLVGCAGVLLLFMAQNYRSAHTSLVRAQVFSDNLVSRMPIGLVALDQDGRITALNSVAETTLGVRLADMVGKNAGEIIPAVLLEILDDTGGPMEKEVLCPVAADRAIPLDVSAAMLTDEDGQHFGRVILFKDLTEMRAMRQELEKNRRLATVGRLAAGVAHEIRNPLSSLKGFATYFKEKYRENDRDQEIAHIMIQEVDRLNRVISQLLEFSRPMHLHLQATPLKPLIEDCLRLIDQQARATGVALALDMHDEGRCVRGDADKMKQVLLNLCYNALDAMPDGGHLTVRVTDAENGAVCLEVQDTGTGIRPKDQPHVFEPYFSTKKSGTGLGLAIVHNIIEAHQGNIRIDSRQGEGTTVRITLTTIPA